MQSEWDTIHVKEYWIVIHISAVIISITTILTIMIVVTEFQVSLFQPDGTDVCFTEYFRFHFCNTDLHVYGLTCMVFPSSPRMKSYVWCFICSPRGPVFLMFLWGG